MMSNVYNRHIISTKSQGFFQTPQEIMDEFNGCWFLKYPTAVVNTTNNDVEVSI